jgi:hypothetical protein
MTLRDEVEVILRRTMNAFPIRWETQGFGMLRTYLEGENEPRLQIWDQRLLVWEYSNIHDHPWDFTSTIVAGHLFNQRYWRMSGCYMSPAGELSEEYNEALIVPGPVNETAPRPQKCWLARKPLELYGPGDQYSQTWNELHCTQYTQGTITVIDRKRTRPDGDHASSIWKGDGPWVSARPRPATNVEVQLVVDNALRTWF